MGAISRIDVRIRTSEENGSGTDGSVFLGICGREFQLDKQGDDNESGDSRGYTIGRDANILHPGDNDPRNPSIDENDISKYPVYIRFLPKDSDDVWTVEDLTMVVNPHLSFDKRCHYSALSGPVGMSMGTSTRILCPLKPWDGIYKVPVYFYVTSNSDGSHRAGMGSGVTSTSLIAKLNAVFEHTAHIRFIDTGVEEVSNTLINNMSNGKDDQPGDPGYYGITDDFTKQCEILHPVARARRAVIVVYRNKNAAADEDYSFTSTKFRCHFISMYKGGNLPHEMGHYLGLSHTFVRASSDEAYFKTIEDAENYFKDHNKDPKIFDGDKHSVSDTPPDPLIVEINEDPDMNRHAKLCNVVFPLCRSNLMSYYNNWDVPETLTPQQVSVCRAGLDKRAAFSDLRLEIGKP